VVSESLSGFKTDGSWDHIVECGERISEALESEGGSPEGFDDWEEWRPKAGDELGRDVAERTAEKASIDSEKVEGGLKGKAGGVFERFEKVVYRAVMGKTGPLYFDNDLVSANIDNRGAPLVGEERFVIEVDIHDTKLKEAVRQAIT